MLEPTAKICLSFVDGGLETEPQPLRKFFDLSRKNAI